jgi:hypothetical protein
MTKIIEVIVKDKSPLKIVTNDKIINDFIIYLNDKYSEWEEFVLSNKYEKQIRILKKENDLIQLPKTISIGHLIVFLDKTYKDWNRFAISKKNFKEIKYEECTVGMLVRASTSNTNLYIYVDSITTNSKEEKEINCISEGQLVTFNTVNCRKYKFKLLSNKINKEDFEAIDWADYK